MRARKHREQWTRNRHISRMAKPSKFYCWACDMALVGDGSRCPVCRTRNGKRDKKRA